MDRFILPDMKISIEEAFLSEMPTEEVVGYLRQKIETGVKLTGRELIEFVISPLSVRGEIGKQDLVEKLLELSDKLDEKRKRFVLSGLAIGGDRFISEDALSKIRRRLTITRVVMMFEKEKEIQTC